MLIVLGTTTVSVGQSKVYLRTSLPPAPLPYVFLQQVVVGSIPLGDSLSSFGSFDVVASGTITGADPMEPPAVSLQLLICGEPDCSGQVNTTIFDSYSQPGPQAWSLGLNGINLVITGTFAALPRTNAAPVAVNLTGVASVGFNPDQGSDNQFLEFVIAQTAPLNLIGNRYLAVAMTNNRTATPFGTATFNLIRVIVTPLIGSGKR